MNPLPDTRMVVELLAAGPPLAVRRTAEFGAATEGWASEMGRILARCMVRDAIAEEEKAARQPYVPPPPGLSVPPTVLLGRQPPRHASEPTIYVRAADNRGVLCHRVRWWRPPVLLDHLRAGPPPGLPPEFSRVVA